MISGGFKFLTITIFISQGLKRPEGLLKRKQRSAAWNLFPEYETAAIPQSLAAECRWVAAARLQVWLFQGRLALY